MAVFRADAAVALDATLGADLAATALALARRYARGATMWCLSPTWAEHARHVAVEFVHPVIVGKRALAAVSVGGPDAVGALRPAARPGDILLAVSPAASTAVAEAMRRAPAWGLTSVWIGCGPRPDAGAADHVLWVSGGEAAAHDGRLVLVYHVLWELTHVCFEHPGLLIEVDDCDADGSCVTCADEGRLAEVDALVDADQARVRTSRGFETIDTTLVGPLRSGDLVLVHGGAAITVLDGE